jgi:N-hydroxyarylamine O-acetyltransferase
MSIDIDTYFARIGYEGPRTPTLATLRALHELHPRAIPFENLDPWLRRPVELAPAVLERKLVREARGGYCYEQNGLFAYVLQALGFDVHGLAARVRWSVPEGVTTPRSHMVLRVELPEGPYLADVGFGVMTLTAPLRLATDVEQATPQGTFRLAASREGFLLEVQVRGDWRPMYDVGLSSQLATDYEVFNWYVSTHPSSRFVLHLIAAQPTESGMLTLMNRELTRYGQDGTAERRTLNTVGELRHVLEHDFAIDLARLEGLDVALQRLLSGSGKSA